MVADDQPADGEREGPEECSRCGSRNVVLGTQTTWYVYLRCSDCNEIWAFPDRRKVPRTPFNTPMRRKGDRRE